MTRIAAHSAVVVAILAGLAVLWQLRGAVLMMVLAMSIAAALRPSIDGLIARGMMRWLALAVVYLAGVAAFAFVALYAGGRAWHEFPQIGDELAKAHERIRTEWSDGNKLEQTLARWLPPPEEALAAMRNSQEKSLIATFLGMTFNLFHLLVQCVVVVVLSLYWNIDHVYFERLWLSLLPFRQRAAAGEVWAAMEREVGAYVRSEVIQCLIAGVILAIGYRAIGYPYPALLAIAGAVAWLIPWIGSLLAVAAVLALSLPASLLHGPATLLSTTLPTALYTLAVMLLLELFVEPRIFDRGRYNSLLLAAVALGLAEALGLIGLVLGPPLAAAAQIIGREWLRHRNASLVGGHRPRSADFEGRLAALREALPGLDAPAPELLNLTERLARLLRDAGQLLDGANPPATPASPPATQPATRSPVGQSPSCSRS